MGIKELQIQLLGGFAIRIDGAALPGEAWRSKRVRNLIKLLALAEGHRLHRDQVIDTLWPDSDLSAAANNFHQTLFAARRVLDQVAPGCLLLDEGYLSLSGDVTVDADVFKTSAARAKDSQDPADYQYAITLYPGDLLPDERYEEWTLARREALRQDYHRLLLELARLYEEQVEYDQVLETLQKLLASDRSSEEAHAGLMRLYALSGQRQAALRQYQALREALKSELDVEPGPETARLYESIQAGQFPGNATEPNPLPVLGQKKQHNLPYPLTTFIGREKEVDFVRTLLQTNHLVTLTGAGGTGKTRLALKAAEGLLDQFRDGLYLIELASIMDPELVPQTCLQALELVIQPGVPAQTILESYLEKKCLLLILDNCEHIITACTRLAAELLKRCPKLTILATSREILSVPGESPFRVPSLAFPNPRSLPELGDIRQYEAIRLFVERAIQVSPGFTLTEGNMNAVATICQRLDGIPLGIELAAARTRFLTADQLASRLDSTFRILTGGSKAVLPRQQTLKATIDWSYDLLTAKEKLLLDRLSVFAGGWTLEAAEAVCADEEGAANAISSLDVIDLLAQLVDKSLVVASIQKDGGRYHLLETIRQYARDRLMETGRGVEVRVRHLAYFAQLSAEAQPHLRATGVVEWLEKLEQEHDNLRVALEWALTSDIVVGLKIVTDLFWFWHIRAHFDEVVALLQKLLAAEAEGRGDQALSGQRALQRARGLHALVHHLAYNTNHPLTSKRIELCQESIAILRELGQSARHDLAVSLLKLLWIQGGLNQPSPLREEMLEIFEGEKDGLYLCEYHWLRLGPLYRSGRFAEVESLLEKGLAILQGLGDLPGMMSRSASLSDLAWYKGDERRADALLQDAIRFSQMTKSRWYEPELHLALASRALSRTDHVEAARIARESLGKWGELNYSIGINMALKILQQTAWSQGELEESIQIGQDRIERYSGSHSDPTNYFHQENLISAYIYLGRAMISRVDLPQAETLLKKALDPVLNYDFTFGWQSLIEFLLAWIALLTHLGEHSRAARLFGAIDSQYQQTKVCYSPRERSEFEENLVSTRKALGEDAFGEAFKTGQGMTLEQALDWIADKTQSQDESIGI